MTCETFYCVVQGSQRNEIDLCLVFLFHLCEIVFTIFFSNYCYASISPFGILLFLGFCRAHCRSRSGFECEIVGTSAGMLQILASGLKIACTSALCQIGHWVNIFEIPDGQIAGKY